MTMTGFDYLATMTEAQLQNQVIALAQRFGWLAYHTHDSRRSQPGFPDLVLTRNGLMILAELKRQNGTTTKAQDEWLFELGKVSTFSSNVQVKVWRPGNLNEIAEVLKKGWKVQL